MHLPAEPSAAMPVRERILSAATRLFYEHGVRGTGIDLVIARSGVAKASFYRYFPSKTDLVVAYLKKRHEDWLTWFDEALESRGKRGGARLKHVADALHEWFSQPEFRGCAFLNVQAEGELGVAVAAEVTAHKEALRGRLHALASAAGHARPGLGADEALLIVEGAIVRAQTTRDPEVAAVARRLLLKL